MDNEKGILLAYGNLLVYYFFNNSICMTIAKIIRHRHKFHHYINDDLKAVSEDVHFKIVFSDPAELDKFEKWCVKNKGKYDYNKDESQQKGKMPKLKVFQGKEVCWCDVMGFYLLHIEGYIYHSALEPYKGEVYHKQ